MAITAAQCHAMTTYYLSGYQEKYKRKPVVNRNKARWGFENVLQDLSTSETKELIDWYFTTNSTNNHSLEWFFYNYDKLVQKKKEYEDDEEERRRLRKESKRRVEEWRQRHSDDN